MNNPTSITISAASESARIAQLVRGNMDKNKVVIVVEGDSDLRLDVKLFNEHAKIEPMYGKLKLLSLDPELYNVFSRNLIAIKDADFDHLNGINPPHKNVFLTDKHDIEMTMIDSEIIESILAEYIGKADNYSELCDGQNLIDNLAENLKDYSYIKWKNDVDNGHINFDAVRMKELEVANSPASFTKSLDIIYSKGCNSRGEVEIIKETDMISFKEEHPCEDLALLVCGHDFCASMVEWIRSVPNNLSGLSKEGLEGIIRMLYSPAKFYATSLYRNIHKWELEYDRSIVA
jgi:hypothetical protein